jgi:hypothetical protein
MRDYHGHQEPLADAAQVAEVFDDQVSSIMPHGGCGQTLWLGPADADPQIRIDIDADRAAMRWVQDGSYVVELDPGDPITVMASPDDGLTTIPAELARVRPQTVRAAVIEYVITQRRPSQVRWHNRLPKR